MLGSFIYSNPTKLYFGENALDFLPAELSNYEPNVMLVYGGGSIKRNGIYEAVVSILKSTGKNIIEDAGVMPNPSVEKLTEGACLAKENNIDLILAVGGGSTIDYAKGVSVSAWYEGDAWTTFYKQQQSPKPNAKIIPVGSILTMVGTGSEMNAGSVITNHTEKLKIGKVFDERVMPRFAILNPKYTYSVPQYQMVAGCFDVMSHLMEQYFSGEDDNTSDYINEGLMRSLVSSSIKAVKNPQDYEARSNIMWTASWALNTLLKCGKKQDWMVHMIGQAVGAHTNSTHGMTLAAVSLPYYRHIMQFGLEKFARFATTVWNISSEGKTNIQVAEQGLAAMEQWMKEIEVYTRLTDLGVRPDMIQGIVNSTIILDSGYHMLTRQDIANILVKSL